ncbi:MAG: GNAT family N-acetyltransferase [Proteobacteria bacterium]|nr:GNAT family N-acetyltransferase [Pseudomonadota bacterium]
MADDANTETWTLDDGKKLTLRHITPDDAGIEQAFVRKLSAQSRYMRFHGTIKELNKKDLATFTNPDPLNAEALIILYKGEKDEDEEEVGVARFVIDPDNQGCEFAIVVADEWQERGLGAKLMQTLISRAKSRGIKQIHGVVLKNNLDMRQFVKKLGFEVTADPDDSSVLLVNKYLGEQSKI